MEARYRTDYPGEFVVLNTVWRDGKKVQDREWIVNPIDNQHLSHRAVCVNTYTDLTKFDYTRLERHRGGLLGSKKVQTYGSAVIAEKMRLDFAVDLDLEKLERLIESGYSAKNIVYTSPRNCITFPGEFYLVPYGHRALTDTLSVYLAAFDGHEEIFLLGYNKETPVGSPRWIDEMADVFASYGGTKFFLVGEPTQMPDEWLNLPNVKSQTVREWVSYCDV